LIVLQLGAWSSCSDDRGGKDVGSGSTSTTSAVATTLAPVRDETVERSVSIEVRGDREVSLKRRVNTRFVTRESKGKYLSVSVASVTFPELIDLGGTEKINPEIAIAGMYEGDGDYTLPAGIGTRPASGPTIKPNEDAKDNPQTVSVAQITFIDLGPSPSELRFGYLLKECKVTVKDGAKTGKADCPALVAINGEKVSMTFEWGP
jgi:hypothetical protein